MESKDLSESIAKYLAVPNIQFDVVKWAKTAEGVKLKAPIAIYIPEGSTLAVVAYLVNRSDSPDTVVNCMADVKTSPDASGAPHLMAAEKKPNGLQLDNIHWPWPPMVRIEPMGFLQIGLTFRASRWFRRWLDGPGKSEPLERAVTLRVNTLSQTLNDSPRLYSVDGLRTSMSELSQSVGEPKQ